MNGQRCDITLTVNGETVVETVDARKTLVDFLREDLVLTGSHVGCEHGVCGACTVRVDGVIVRGCLMLAAQCDGAPHGPTRLPPTDTTSTIRSTGICARAHTSSTAPFEGASKKWKTTSSAGTSTDATQLTPAPEAALSRSSAMVSSACAVLSPGR